MKESQVCCFEWAGSECRVCLSSVQHCSFAVAAAAAVAAAVGFGLSVAVSTAGLEQAPVSVAVGC